MSSASKIDMVGKGHRKTEMWEWGNGGIWESFPQSLIPTFPHFTRQNGMSSSVIGAASFKGSA